MTEVLSLRAGGRRVDLSTDPEAGRIKDWDWGSAGQTPWLAEGRYGGQVLGDAEWEQSRAVRLDVTSSAGNVPGDGTGYAVARVWGRAWQSVTAGSPGDILTPAWLVDTSDSDPQAVDLSCEVQATAAGTVTLEVVRAGSIVASKSQAVAAGVTTRIDAPAKAVTGTAPVSMRARLASAATGVTLKARKPVYGVGLNCVYHDPYTPGTSRTFVVNKHTGSRGSGGGSVWSLNLSSGMTDTGSGWGAIPDGSGDYGYRCKGTNTTASLRQVGCVRPTPFATWTPHAAGTPLTVSVDVFGTTLPTTNGARIQVDWHDSAGAYISSSVSGYTLPIAGRNPRLVFTTGNSPGGTVYARIATAVLTSAAEAVDVWFGRWSVGSALFVDGDAEQGAWDGPVGASTSHGYAGPCSRPSSGERWANAFTAGLGEVAGLVASDPSAVLVQASDALGDTLEWSVFTGKTSPERKNIHARGAAAFPVELSVGPLGVGVRRSLPGTLGSDGVWRASAPVVGDADALCLIAASFGASTSQATAQIASADPVVFPATSWSDTVSGASSVTASGSRQAQALQSVLPYASAGLDYRIGTANWNRGAGTFEVDVRAFCRPGGGGVGSTATVVALLVNGTEVASTVLRACFQSGWQTLRFGRVVLPSSGADLTITASSAVRDQVTGFAAGVTVTADEMRVTPAVKSAALLAGGPQPLDLKAGATTPSGSASLSGQSGGLGGTWAATNWESVAYSGFRNTSIGAALIGSENRDVAARFQVSFGVFGGVVGCGAYQSGGAQYVKVWAHAADLLTVEVKASAGTVQWSSAVVAVAIGQIYDIQVVADRTGRWEVWYGVAGVGMRRVASGTADSDFSGSGWAAGLESMAISTGSLTAYDVRLMAVGIPAIPTNWSTGADGVTAAGGLPYLAPGSVPRVIMRGGGDHSDAPHSQGYPSSVAVLYRPRYTGIPRP